MPLDDDLNKAENYLLGLEESTIKEITKNYAIALKAVKFQLSAMYEKFGDGVTHIDMAKFHRLQNLEKVIQGIMIEYTGKNARVLTTSLVNMYEESFLYTGYALERETQMKLAYTAVNKEVAMLAIQNPISGLTLNQTLRKNRQDIILNVNRHIMQGLILGEGNRKMANRITHLFQGDVKKAIRVVNTESHRVTQSSRLSGIKHAASKGVKMLKVWDASLDGSTRPAHQKLDGKKIAVDEDFQSTAGGKGPAPGQMGTAADDINCRCSLRTEIAGYEPHVRRARNAITDKNEVIPYTTYEEWKKNRIT